MARRRRRKQDQALALVVILGILAAAAVLSVVAFVRVAWPYLLATVLAVAAWDIVAALREPERRPRFRLARAVARSLGFVVRLVTGRVRLGQRWTRIRVQTLGELLTLTPRHFEQAVATMLSDRGYRDVEIRGGPGDLGVDIACRDASGARVVVQCKRYAPGNSVGSPDMQRFLGMLRHQGADRGLYVTTSGFTKSARALAHGYPITLMDGAELSRLIAGGSVLPQREVAPAAPVGTDAI